MKNMDFALDCMRIIAMVMVIYLHASFADKDASQYGFLLGGINFLFQPAVPLFLMLSGSLLLSTKDNTFDFINKRMGKVLWPTLIWSVIYLLFKELPISEFLCKIISLPFSCQGHPILWYMYVLIGLYLLTPILATWLRTTSKQEVEFYLIIWLIALSLPYIGIVAETDVSVTSMLYYFNGYLGYYVGGYYLLKYINNINVSLLIFIACVIWLLAIGLRVSNIIDEEFVTMFGNLTSLGAIINFAWFVGLYKLFSKFKFWNSTSFMRRYLTTVSGLTFGVYLSHIAIYKTIVWTYICPFIGNYPLKLFVGGLTCCIITFIFCYIISLIPYSQYLIWFHKKCN